MRKGRHRRFEEARALKRLNEPDEKPCVECGADPEDDHASWCVAPVEDLLDEQEAVEKWTRGLTPRSDEPLGRQASRSEEPLGLRAPPSPAQNGDLAIEAPG